MKRKLIPILTILILTVGFFVYVNLFKPKVLDLSELSKFPAKKKVILNLENPDKASEIVVKVIQNGREYLIFKSVPKKEISFEIEPKKLGLKEGEANVIVEFKRLIFLKETQTVKTFIDYTPPRIRYIFKPYSVMNGGSGALRIESNEEIEAFIQLKEMKFPLYKVGKKEYFGFFAVPINFSRKDLILVIAKDKVGNITKQELSVRLRKVKYPVYKIELTRIKEKLKVKLSNLLNEEVNENNFVDAFKKVNEDMRRENEEEISRIGKNSEKKILWKGKFLQLKRSKVISVFGEKRIYTYRGKKISESYHWGYDLASVKNAPVEASNSGKVVFTGFLGIYGNTVIIDHGYGLMSVYSHLLDFKVKKGDFVKKGQIIGYTDQTGLAFGDHLHFGIMINGVFVNPIEWWDKNWIKNNILPAIQSNLER